MSKTNTGLVEYCKAQLGKPYWMGTFGQTASAALLAQKRRQLPVYYSAADFPTQYGQRVHDCIGLIKGYIWSETPTSAPVYASNGCPDIDESTMYMRCKEKGMIGTLPEIPGVLVFFEGHVGVYIGGGEVIEARGHAWGVVRTRLKDRPWNKWGMCPYIEYEEDSMTGEQIYKALNDYLREQPCPEWAKAELEEAVKLGITDGSRPCELIPRYQAAIMAKRAKENR